MRNPRGNPRFRMLPIVTGIASMTVAAAPLWAAEADKPVLLAQATTAAPAAPAATGSRIEEVVITARRDEESQQTVPVAVTALSDEALKAAAVTSVFDLAAAVPGLFVAANSQGGAPTFAIRAAKADNGTSDTVTAYVDDVPMAHTKAIANMTYDLASITTLKGPQGTFFGTSTTGGAIIFRPNKPSDTFEGYVELGVGNWGRKTFEGMVNIPINDVLQVRIAGDMVRRDKGFVKNEGVGRDNLSDEDHRSMRLSVRLKPTTNLLNDLVVNYFWEDSEITQEAPIAHRDRYNYTTFIDTNPDPMIFAPLVVPVDYAMAGIGEGGPWNVNIGPYPTWNRFENIDVANTTTYEINDNLSIKNVIGYQRARSDTAQDNDAGPLSGVNGRTAYNIWQWTEEFSVDSKFWDGRLRNKTGVFLSKREIEAGNAYRVIGLPWDTTGIAAPLVGALNTIYPLGSNSYYWREFQSKAIYTQFAYDITDTLTATLGARYTWDEGDYTASNKLIFDGGATFGDFFLGNCNANPAVPSGLATYKDFNASNCTGKQDFKTSAPAYVFTLENKFSDRQMAYATIRHGYLVGGFNNQVFVASGEGQTFLPEEVTDTEFGLKSDWDLFGRPIRTNAAFFFGHYKNQQRVQNGTTAEGTTYIAVQNAGATTFYGWDLDVIYDVTDWLRLTLGWNHVIATYDNFKAPLNMPGATGAFVDYQGQQLAQTPEDIVSISGTVTWPLSTDNGTLKSTLTWYWRDDATHHDAPVIGCTFKTAPPYNATNQAGECVSVIPDQDFREFDVLDDYAIVNFTTEWKNVMGSPFDVRFWVKNLFDKEYKIYGSNQMLQFGYATYFYGNPREYGLNVRYNF